MNTEVEKKCFQKNCEELIYPYGGVVECKKHHDRTMRDYLKGKPLVLFYWEVVKYLRRLKNFYRLLWFWYK